MQMRKLKKKINQKKRQAARIELMKDVFKDRANAVMRKKELEEDEKKQLLKEREILDNEIEKYNEQLNLLKTQEYLKNKNEQEQLKYHIQEKRRTVR